MGRMLLVGAWILVVAGATALTWQVVSAADAQVSDRPASPLNVAAPAISSNATSTTTTLPTETTPSTLGPPPPTTTTTVAGTTSTTTVPTTEPSWTVKTIPTDGGTIVVKYRPNEVELQTVSPAAGFRAEVEDWGPPEAQVEFESSSTKIEVHAKWDSGDLKVEISGEDDH